MSDHFNKLLLQRLEEIGTRLGRLEGRLDQVISEKADKADVKDVQTELKDVKSDVDTLRKEVSSQE